MSHFWAITDTHLGHENIKRYENRPENFEQLILENCKTMVQPGDVFIHLGDVAFANWKYWHEQLLESVQGAKTWLILGNHDRRSPAQYLNLGWDFVGEGMLLNMFGKRLLFTHEPKEIGRGGWNMNVHGHLHSKHITGEGHRDFVLDNEHRLLYIEHEYKPIDLRRVIEGKELSSNGT